MIQKRTTNSNPMMSVLPLRDIVVFPQMVVPLFVGREKSLSALRNVTSSEKANKELLLVAQRDAGIEDPSSDDLFDVGTVARVVQSLKLPDGTFKVLVEGIRRVRVTQYKEDEQIFAEVEDIPQDKISQRTFEPLRRTILTAFTEYQKNNKRITNDQLNRISSLTDPEQLITSIAQLLVLSPSRKQDLLATVGTKDRLELLFDMLEEEVDIQQTEKRIRGRVKKAMEKNQRDYYLNEQVKAIQKELGDTDEEFEEIERKIKAAKMSPEGEEKALGELKKLRLQGQNSAEANVIRNYIDTLISLPWSKRTRVNTNLIKAEAVLEEDHYGLEKVKERILEYLAVQSRVKNVKSPILCLVGPPGVGKTSLGQSIARATGRKFVRLALGGVRDESEIRGHRRTYIGSMPGRILQSLTKAETNNPLFLLDEVDKMGMDYRGDPAAALLEVLDPEQNNTFQDHYVEVDFDLSHVMFIATSNSMNIPAPLLDRMEVIQLSGYTEDEKLHIAQRHLIPKQMKLNGVKPGELEIEDSAIVDIVRYYTREAGVRSLEREINKICRKTVRDILLKKTKGKVVANSDNLDYFLGVRRYNFGVMHKGNQVGQVTGLAWTEVGGDLLTIEVATMPGKGQITRLLHRDAVRNGGHAPQLRGAPGVAGQVHGRRARRLNAHDPAVRLQLLHRKGDAADEAAAPDGHHDLLYLGALVQNLQGNGPLAAHSIPVRGGVHIVQMLFFCQLTRIGISIVIDISVQDHFRTVALCTVHFYKRCNRRHNDNCFTAKFFCGKGNALSVISRRCRDQSSASFFIR